MGRRRILTLIAGITAAILFTISFGAIKTSPVCAQPISLTVSAAISLTNALQEIKTIYQNANLNVSINYNFASSGALQQQIVQGAPVDVFFSAAAKQMDVLQQENLLLPGTRKTLLTNRLVLITPKNAPPLTSFRNLTNSQVRRIAIAEPRSVPAGQYAQELLANLKLFNLLKSKLVYGNNVRQVLTYVETGDVDAGIVYTTDAKASNSVRVGATAPSNLHSPIVYPVAALKGSRNVAAARNFIQFLSSTQAKAVFQKYGFGINS
ncbi:MAG: molybdate ABC transporter substrate-binding protein [Chroococcus sp. CMT-3BRIN-NPC107]|jgi:molybdate transport system substrate-binding protein|nr:molybdate ABC transporter substrate-binding protein [Chroococcus sp. CMT-3BRIN-NPC107]